MKFFTSSHYVLFRNLDSFLFPTSELFLPAKDSFLSSQSGSEASHPGSFSSRKLCFLEDRFFLRSLGEGNLNHGMKWNGPSLIAGRVERADHSVSVLSLYIYKFNILFS